MGKPFCLLLVGWYDKLFISDMKLTKDKICLQLINLLMNMIFVFFDVFFSIYIFDMSNNINFVLGYNLFGVLLFVPLEMIFVRVLNKHNFNAIYRLSFLTALLSIGLVFTINTERLFMVFIVRGVYALTKVFYYLPHEVAMMNYNTNSKSMKSFVGVAQLLEVFAAMLSPFISGYVIDYISYTILFTIIALIAGVCFVLSFWVKRGWVDVPSIKLKDFIQGTHQIKKIRLTYLAYGLYKFSQNSVTDILLPVLLFMKVGTNFSVGLYSALAIALSGIVLMIYLKLYRFKNPILIICTVLSVSVAALLICWASLVSFFIYYFVIKCCHKIISNRATQDNYVSRIGTEYAAYHKEHHLTYNLYDHAFKLIGFLLAFLIYNLIPNQISLSLILLALALMQIVSSVLFIKAEKLTVVPATELAQELKVES